jgi:hypothetical protein
MQIKKVLAAVAVSDMSVAEGWYAKFLNRPADAHPMDGLVEWHFGEAVLQLVRDAERAGGSLSTLHVDVLGEGERERTSFGAEFRRELDPDGNAITLIAYRDPGATYQRAPRSGGATR